MIHPRAMTEIIGKYGAHARPEDQALCQHAMEIIQNVWGGQYPQESKRHRTWQRLGPVNMASFYLSLLFTVQGVRTREEQDVLFQVASLIADAENDAGEDPAERSGKKARELQEQIIVGAHLHQAITGNEADRSPYREVVTLIGQVWKVPETETQQRLDAVCETQSTESASPLTSAGLETPDLFWGLFETAIHLDSPQDRLLLLHLAQELSELQSLLDWIRLTTPEPRPEKELERKT